MTIIAAALFAMMQQGSAAPVVPTPRPSPCASEQYTALDFWVGDWNVYQTGSDTQVATSRIEKVSNGCAIRESWMPLRGPGGTSLSSYDAQTGLWNQLWIGAQPGIVFFEGGPVEGSMVLTGYWGQDAEGKPSLVRMTYSQNADGSVRQYGQASSDHGLSWTDSFDLTYRSQGGSAAGD